MRIPFIDSHTGGEPTRVILDDAIELRGSTMIERRDDFATRLDGLRAAIVSEPRGSDILVAALLTPPVSPDAVAGVIYFNPAGMIGMCGHGTIGVVETLRHLGKIEPGAVKLDTPVGTVQATLHNEGDVEIRNVTSRRYRADVEVEVEGIGTVRGDVAYGGNWFYIVQEPHFDVSLDRTEELAAISWRVRRALERVGIRGERTPEHAGQIDHIELEGPGAPGADSRNFVLCPGGAYDRSPCGTGTSAKLACLHARSKLAAGEWYVQESVTGSRFRGKVEPVPGGVIPTIVGRAHVTAEGTLLFEAGDPSWSGMTT